MISVFLQKANGNMRHAVAWRNLHTLGAVLISVIQKDASWAISSQCAVLTSMMVDSIHFIFTRIIQMIMVFTVWPETFQSGQAMLSMSRHTIFNTTLILTMYMKRRTRMQMF